MSDSKNGQNNNGKEKEIDRLLKLIDSIARVDTKLTVFADQYKIDLVDIKEKINIVTDNILDIEKRRNEIIKTASDLQESFNKWKIYFSLISFIGAPAVTTLIIYLIEHFVLHVW